MQQHKKERPCQPLLMMRDAFFLSKYRSHGASGCGCEGCEGELLQCATLIPTYYLLNSSLLDLPPMHLLATGTNLK